MIDLLARGYHGLRVPIALLLLAGAGCGAPDAPSPPRPASILCLGSELCAVLVELGLGPAVVAADSESVATRELAHAFDIGEPTAPSPAIAKRAAPQLALVLAEASPLELEGVPVHVFAPEDANAVLDAIHRIGALTGTRVRAAQVAARFTREISEIAVRRDGKHRRRVAWILGGDPLVVVGGSGLRHELLELAGAENAFHTPPDAQQIVTAAEIAAQDPDEVLDGRLDPALGALPLLDLPGRVRALHALIYPEPVRAGETGRP